MLSSDFNRSISSSDSSSIAPIVVRILPMSMRFSSCMAIACASASSSMKPWLTRKWPSHSLGSVEPTEVMRPSWK